MNADLNGSAQRAGNFKFQDGKYFYTNKGGLTFELKPFPPLQAPLAEQAARKRAAEQFGEPVKPRYQVEETGEWFDHDETTLTTDEHRAEWDKYQATIKKTNEYVGDQMMRFFLFYGVNVNPDHDQEWETRQRHFGIEIPADPIDRKIHYIQTELVFSGSDIQEISTYLMTLAGVKEEMIEAATNSFRDSVG